MTKPFNMGAFATKNTAKMELMHIDTGEATGVFFTILGTDSDEFVKGTHALMKRTGRNDLDLEEVVEGQNELLAAITKGWDDISMPMDLNGITAGDPYPYSHENAVELYKNFPALRDQVDAFAGKRANFIKK